MPLFDHTQWLIVNFNRWVSLRRLLTRFSDAYLSGFILLVAYIRRLLLILSVQEVLFHYVQPLLLWIGTILICRALEPVILPGKANHALKQQLLHFIRSLGSSATSSSF